MDFINKKPKTEAKKPSTAPPAPRSGDRTATVPVKKPVTRTVAAAARAKPIQPVIKPKTAVAKVEKKEVAPLPHRDSKMKLTIPQPFAFAERAREPKKAETSRAEVGLKKVCLTFEHIVLSYHLVFIKRT